MGDWAWGIGHGAWGYARALRRVGMGHGGLVVANYAFPNITSPGKRSLRFSLERCVFKPITQKPQKLSITQCPMPNPQCPKLDIYADWI